MSRNRGQWIDGTPRASDGLPLVSEIDQAPAPCLLIRYWWVGVVIAALIGLFF